MDRVEWIKKKLELEEELSNLRGQCNPKTVMVRSYDRDVPTLVYPSKEEKAKYEEDQIRVHDEYIRLLIEEPMEKKLSFTRMVTYYCDDLELGLQVINGKWYLFGYKGSKGVVLGDRIVEEYLVKKEGMPHQIRKRTMLPDVGQGFQVFDLELKDLPVVREEPEQEKKIESKPVSNRIGTMEGTVDSLMHTWKSNRCGMEVMNRFTICPNCAESRIDSEKADKEDLAKQHKKNWLMTNILKRD